MKPKKNPLPLMFFLGVFLVASFCTAAPLMIEKNLFAQDRKAPSPESATGPAQPGKGMQVNNIQLDGVIIQGDTKKALVRLKAPTVGPDRKKQTPFLSVRENQQVGDIRVVKIEPKSISVEKDGQTYVIGLFAEGKVVVPAAVQPPPSAPVAPVPAPVPGAPDQEGAVMHPGAGGVPPQAGVPQQPGRRQRGVPQQGMQGQQVMQPQGQQVMQPQGQQQVIDPSMAQQAQPIGEGVVPPMDDDDDDEDD